MRIVLPPSETKTPGGHDASRLEWDQLVFSHLTTVRQTIAEDLVALSVDPDAAKNALGLGAQGDEWVVANRELLSSPVMPAIHRYTGVLFDALDIAGLDAVASTRAGETLWVFSALFGPLRARDQIPRYRLSCDSKLPGATQKSATLKSATLKSRWQPHAEQIWEGDFSIDFRSEGYRALAPLPPGTGVFIRVVKDLERGAAVGHANKATKGKVVRDLLTTNAHIDSVGQLLDWAATHGWHFAKVPDNPAELYLVAG